MSVTRKKLNGAFLIWLFVGGITTAGLALGALQEIENRTWDWRVRITANPSARNEKIKIITIDQDSLAHFAAREKIYWPWPRSLYNPVLLFLQKAGAKAVAFDMLFTESSTFVADDLEFAKVMRSSIPVVNAVALRNDVTDPDSSARALFIEEQRRASSVISRYLDPSRSISYQGELLPIREVMVASAALGNVTAAADSDQIFRRAWAGAQVGEIPVLNLPFALHSVVTGDEFPREKLREMATGNGSHLIRFFGPSKTYDTYSLHSIVASWLAINEGSSPVVSPEEFKDSFVFIGATAPGLLDVRSVPFPGAYSGVEVNATIFDNLLNLNFMRECPLVLTVATTLLALAFCCTGGLFLPWGELVAQVVIVVAWIGACFYGAHLGWWLPLIIPLGGLFMVMLLTSFLQYQIEGRQHRFIRNAFRYYLSPEVIDKIVADPSSLRLGGDRRELTIFFSDIQGFTGISERLPPDQLVHFLNLFLSEMSAIILETGGTLDKYQGDAVIAFWNAPLELLDHRDRAIEAAIKCQRRLRELAPEFERRFGIVVRMRVGIHTGSVSVGNFGSSQRFNYTMIGDSANVASRLEGVNKVFGTRIIASESTKRDSSEKIKWRSLGQVRVVGRKEPVTIYQPLEEEIDGLILRDIDVYNHGLALFARGDLVAAESVFGKMPDDPVSAAYRARIQTQLKSGTHEVVWDLKEK